MSNEKSLEEQIKELRLESALSEQTIERLEQLLSTRKQADTTRVTICKLLLTQFMSGKAPNLSKTQKSYMHKLGLIDYYLFMRDVKQYFLLSLTGTVNQELVDNLAILFDNSERSPLDYLIAEDRLIRDNLEDLLHQVRPVFKQEAAAPATDVAATVEEEEVATADQTEEQPEVEEGSQPDSTRLSDVARAFQANANKN